LRLEAAASRVAREPGDHRFRDDSALRHEARMIPFILFFFCAALAIVGAVALIWAWEPIHSALSLILVMMALAVLYLLLGAEFIAAVQIIVYAGAVMVLFVFVIMLLNAGTEERTNWSKLAMPVGVVLSCFLLLAI